MGYKIFSSWAEFPLSQGLSKSLNVLCMDSKIAELYGEIMMAFFQENLPEGARVECLIFPAGEGSKSREQKQKLEEALFAMGATRETKLFALGGGVTGDLVGFVAATFMRGLSYINLPTSLLAMVDSSIGGKTGINTAYGKNTLGAFWPAEETWIALDFLQTLDETQKINGYMEALKMFFVLDAEALTIPFEKVEIWLPRAIACKQKIVNEDPFEKGSRAVLNFGHTVAHALEKLDDYQGLHGHAVAWGMLAETWILWHQGFLNSSAKEAIFQKVQNFALAENFKKFFKNSKLLLEAMRGDKKNQQGGIYFVALKDLGLYAETFTLAISEEKLHNSLEAFSDFLF